MSFTLWWLCYVPWSNGADGPLFAHGLLTTTFALPFCAVWGNLQLFQATGMQPNFRRTRPAAKSCYPFPKYGRLALH